MSKDPDVFGSPLLNKYQAAALLGVDTRTIETWVSEGQLKILKIGRNVWITKPDLMRALRANGKRCPRCGVAKATMEVQLYTAPNGDTVIVRSCACGWKALC